MYIDSVYFLTLELQSIIDRQQRFSFIYRLPSGERTVAHKPQFLTITLETVHIVFVRSSISSPPFLLETCQINSRNVLVKPLLSLRSLRGFW